MAAEILDSRATASRLWFRLHCDPSRTVPDPGEAPPAEGAKDERKPVPDPAGELELVWGRTPPEGVKEEAYFVQVRAEALAIAEQRARELFGDE